MLQLESGRYEVENAYARAVTAQGNTAAKAMLEDVFAVSDRTWRGIGSIPDSGWQLAPKYAYFDAEERFSVTDIHTDESSVCRSGEVLQGLIKPHECSAFGKECTPRNPARCHDGVVRGGVRRVLPVPAPGTSGGGVMPAEETAVVDLSAWVCPLPLRDSPNIVMGHGGGGAMSAELIEHLFLPSFGSAADAELGDSAVFDVGGVRLAFSTDSYVVKPMVFPGGTIGDLAVNGTVNDLAMVGAQPLVMSTAFILEEGTALTDIAGIAKALGEAAHVAGRSAGDR